MDPLTELPNRRAFSERVGAQIGGERASDATGLMLVDLDEFKEINTLHGHPGGDRVLCETARGLRSAAREEDMVSRIGGDEFAIVLQSVNAEGMHQLAERVLDSVRATSSRLSVELPGIAPDGQRGLGALPRYGAHARRADHGGGHQPARRQGQRQGRRGVADRLGAASLPDPLLVAPPGSDHNRPMRVLRVAVFAALVAAGFGLFQLGGRDGRSSPRPQLSRSPTRSS